MKKFIMDKDFTDLFPQAKIGILVCEGIDGKVKDENRYMPYLAEAMQACKIYGKSGHRDLERSVSQVQDKERCPLLH